MDRPLKQANLQAEKTLLNKVDTSNENGELFLKCQCYAVVNLIRDLDPDIGEILKEDINELWKKFYEERKTWNPTETFGGASSIEQERQKIEFETKQIQKLHIDINETVQNAVDVGELLE